MLVLISAPTCQTQALLAYALTIFAPQKCESTPTVDGSETQRSQPGM